MKKTVISLVIGLCLLLAGFSLGALYWHHKDVLAIVKPLKAHNLLADRLFLDNPSDNLLDFGDLRKQVTSYADANIGAANTSISFNYLPTGSNFGYGETREFTGASLLKLPLIMDMYYLAEQGKINLDSMVALKPEWLDNRYGTLYQKGAGYKLSYRQAAELALKDSDNTAILMVQDVVKNANINSKEDILNYLDVEYNITGPDNFQIGAQSYNSFLKCLYYSCYLKLDDSQQILHYMTASNSSNRLTAQLPDGVVVAHKIGAFNTEVQSDCGVFYVRGRNYALCVMLKESDPAASQHIGDISKLIYDYVTHAITAPQR